MHDKPTDETTSAPEGSLESSRSLAEPPPSMAELPERVAELTAVDPAEAPDIADEIAAALETSLDSAPASPADARSRGPGAVPDAR